MNRAGYVLVGGGSTRMGRDKALMMGQSVARVVSAAAGSVVLVGNPERYGKLGYPVIPDLYPGEGPLGGILTALRHTSAEWNLLTACDMPALTEAFLRGLLESAEQAQAEAWLPVGPSGHLEVLCGVYRRSMAAALQAAFDRGVRKVRHAFPESPGVHRVQTSEVVLFQNVNTPEEWSAHGAK